MKKLLLCLLLISQVTFAQSFSDYEQYIREQEKRRAAPELSLDPKSPMFCMFFNPFLHIESYTTNTKDMYDVFDKNESIDRLDNDYIWFSLHERYYKLWIPEDSLVFIVKLPKNRHEILGWHLINFINVLRMHCVHQQQEAWKQKY